MNIFESLENLNVSEECFDEIMGIVEEYINELKDPTVASAHNKRIENYRNALGAATANPSNSNLKNYMSASNKLARNSRLSFNAFNRSGNTKNAQTVSPTRQQKISDEYKVRYNQAKDASDSAVNSYNDKLHYDREQARGTTVANALQIKGDSERSSLKDKANKAVEAAKQARKDYHDVMDRTNTVPRDINTLKSHLEYQRTHDEKGNRK